MPGFLSFNSMTIRGRLIALGVVATLGFASVVGAGWYGGSQTIGATHDADVMREKISIINEMRLANIELVLAAMDSIIDKAEGKLLPERAETIKTSIATIRDNKAKTEEMARILGRPEMTLTMEDDLAEVEQAISVDLPRLIETNAPEEEFAALDDAIDGGGERLNASLSALADLGNQTVEQKLASAEATAVTVRKWQVAITAFFLMIVGVLTTMTVRHVGGTLARFGTNMESIAAGNLDIEIDAANRKDEVGRMARSLAVFRDAAIQKLALEREAEENRSMSERERMEREAAKEEERRQTSAAVDALGSGLNRLAEGDLSVRLNTPFTGALEVLRVDFNKSVEKLNATLIEVRENITAIDGDAAEMRSAADDLSRRTEQQAASLEETSAALEEITATVRGASERAGEATQMAKDTQSATDRSGKVVADAVDAMGRIETASQKIGQIITVIDEIAFQTNLLALNAGVEAARAGEAGMGFAVVAQEVRELAQRSAAAAREIKALIQNSGAEVANGVSLVRATGEALAEIAQQVTAISEHITSIATASKEQATGIQEINVAVSQMDQMTQQNAAMVEESTAVTHRLSGEAKSLAQLIGQFNLSGAQIGEASEQSTPVSSPARGMMQKVMRAFGS